MTQSTTSRKEVLEWWRPDIQGLRGIAVILVIAYHAGLPLQGGFIGVDVFFVISGFVITSLVIRRLRRSEFRFSDFFWRRFTRLVPALAVVVAFVQFSSIFLLSPIGQQMDTGLMGIGSLMFTANVFAYFRTENYFDNGSLENPLLNMWTLSVEEQFYVCAALLVFVFLIIRDKLGHRLSTWFMPVVVVGLFMASFLLNIATSFRTNGTLVHVPEFLNPAFAFYSPFTRAWEFLAGAFLALMPIAIRHSLIRRIMRSLGFAAILGTAIFLTPSIVFPGLVVLLPVAGTVLILAAYSPSESIRRTLVASGPLVGIGNVSYSWYLWHWPFIIFTFVIFGVSVEAGVIAAIASLVPAYISFRYLESPMKNIRTIDLALVAKWVIPPLILSVLVVILSVNHWFSPQLRSFEDQTAPELNGTLSCPILVEDYGMGSRICTWPDDSGDEIVYLVGDSTAALYGDQLEEIFGDKSQLISMTHPGCPVYGVEIYWVENQIFSPNTECNRFNELVTELLLESSPGRVILAASSVPFYAPNIGIASPGEEPSSISDFKNAALGASLPRFVTALQEVGHSVELVQSSPAFFVHSESYLVADQWRPQLCVGTDLLAIDSRCGANVSISVLDSYQGATRQTLEAVAQHLDLPMIDPRESLCGPTMCSTNSGEQWFYVDGIHLNSRGVKAVSSQFMRAGS